MKAKSWIKLIVALLIISGLAYLAFTSPAIYEKETSTNEETGEEVITDGDVKMSFGVKQLNGGMNFNSVQRYTLSPITEVEVPIEEAQTEVPVELDTEAPVEETVQTLDDIEDGTTIESTAAVPLDAEPTTTTKTIEITREMLEQSRDIMIERLDFNGVEEYNIYIDYDNNKIILEIPDNDDAYTIANYVGKQGNLQFVDINQEVRLTADDVKEIKADLQTLQDGTHEWYVTFVFTDEGAKKFADATEAIAGMEPYSFDLGNGQTFEYPTNILAVTLDGAELQSFRVSEKIEGGQASIGLGNKINLIKQIKSLKSLKKLPVNFEIGSTTIEKNLDINKVNTGIKTAVYVFGFAVLFLIIKYKMGGLIASIVYCGFVSAYIVVTSMLQITFTTLGIYGVVFSAIIAYAYLVYDLEGLNKELKVGKSLKGAISSSYAGTKTSILNSNLVIGLISLSLLFAESIFKPFALFVLLGAILSLVMVVVNKFLLNQFCNVGLSREDFYAYGIRRKENV